MLDCVTVFEKIKSVISQTGNFLVDFYAKKIKKWFSLISKECDVLLSCVAPLPLPWGCGESDSLLAYVFLTQWSVLIKERNNWPMFVATLLLYGGLYHMMCRFCFLNLFSFVLSVQSGI